jgi:hypothetical protein
MFAIFILDRRVNVRGARPRSGLRSTVDGDNAIRTLAGNITEPKTLTDLIANHSLIPGMKGVRLLPEKIPGTKGGKTGISFGQMWELSIRDGIEYLLTRRMNPDTREGEIWLYSGHPNAVSVPPGERPIAHTHPITNYPVNPLLQRFPSPEDITVLNNYWKTVGGSEPMSRIIWGSGPKDFTFFSALSKPNSYSPKLPYWYRGPQGRVGPNE